MGNSTANGRNWKKRALACLLAFSMVAQQGGVTFAGETDPAVVAAAEQDAAAAAQAESERIAREQAEAEAKAKAEEEARIKAEEEARIKAEEEARAKAEAEEKARQESEAKAKAEAEAKAKAEAEAKAKAESEAKAKAESEAAAKAKEESEKAAAESEKKAKEESEKAANAESSSEAASTESQNTPSETKPETEIQSESQKETEIQSETSDAHDADAETTVSETQMSETETAVSESETESETETEEEFKSGILRESGNGYQITLTYDETARIPEEARIVSREIVQGTAEYEALLAQAHARMGITDAVDKAVTQARFFDITIVDKKGRTLEPESGVTVEITYSKPVEVENANDIDMVHFAEGGAEILDVEATKVNQNGDIKKIEFEADSFSTYGLIYTVDFTYKDGYTYQMPGGEQMLLSELFDALDINESTANVIEVVFTDDSLLTVEKTEDDYVLKSLKPFTSEETLTVTVNDPTTSEVVKYVIDVTDEQENNNSSTNLKDYLTNATISAPTNEEGKYVVMPDTKYSIKLSFAENASIQFPDSGSMTYKLPGDLSAVAGEGNMTIKVNAGGKTYEIKNNPYSLSADGDLTLTFNDSDPNWSKVTASDNLRFTLSFEGEFTENAKQIQFSNSVVKDVVVDTTNSVTASKVANVDKSNNKIHYTVAIESKGNSTNINIKDTLTGEGLTLDGSSIQADSSTGVAVTFSKSDVSGNSFDYIIPSMKDGERITFSYSADINPDVLHMMSGKVVTTAGNSVKVESDGDKDNEPITVTNVIDYTPDMWKAGGDVVSQDENGATQKWTVTVNPSPVVSAAGTKVTDKIKENSQQYMKYSGDGITVLVKDKNGTTVRTDSVAWNKLDYKSDTTWTYTIPDTDKGEPYSYEISYTTFADTSTMTKPTQMDNEAHTDGGKNGEGHGQVVPQNYVNPELEKTHTNVDVANREVTWQVSFVVPAGGLTNAVLKDTYPNQWLTGKHAIEAIKAGTLTVTGLVEGENYELDTTASAEYALITFTNNGKPGMKGTGVPRTIMATFKTVLDDDWLRETKADAWKKDHTNNVELDYGTDKTTDDDTVPVLSTDLKKTASFLQTRTVNGIELPVYKYEILLSGVTDANLLIEDTFDTSLLEPYAKSDWGDWKLLGGDPYYQGAEGASKVSYLSTDTGIQFRTNAASMPLDKNGAFFQTYKLTYYLTVKDASALYALQKQAAENGGAKTIGNTATWGTETDTGDVTYQYDAINKEILTSDDDLQKTDTDIWADYRITINPAGVQMNGGNPMEMTDAFENLSIDYTSIQAVPSAGVSWDFSGNTATFTIPDETKVVITYRARVTFADIGAAGDTKTQVIKNTATIKGYSDDVSKSASRTNSGEGAADIYAINLLKYQAGDMTHTLSGAVFQLLDKDKNPVRYTKDCETHKAGDSVTYTTGTDGLIHVEGDQGNYGWALQPDQVYYLREIKAPTGYKLLNYDTSFTISSDGSTDYNLFIYHSGDTMSAKNFRGTQVPVKKIWTDGNDAHAGETVTVKLYVKAKGSSADPVPYQVDNTDVTLDLSASNGWEGIFLDLPLDREKSEDEVEELEYSVQEVSTGNDYTAVISGNAEDGFTITNTPQKGNLKVVKNIVPSEVAGAHGEKSYKFQITREIGEVKYYYKEDGTSSTEAVTISVTLAANAESGNTEIKNLNPGKYTVTELDDDSYAIDGYTVEIDSAKTPTVAAGQTVNAEFTNKYIPNAVLKLKGMKFLDGVAAPTAGAFSFTISGEADGMVLPTTAEVSNDSNGSFVFDDIKFTKAGTYTLKLKENKGGNNAINYDTQEYTLTVVVEKENDAFTVRSVKNGTKAYSKGSDGYYQLYDTNDATFKNTTKKGKLTIKKLVTGDVPEGLGHNFEFTLTKGNKWYDASGEHDSETKITVSDLATAGVTIDSLELGTYTLTEVTGLPDGDSTHTMVTTLVDSTSGTIGNSTVSGKKNNTSGSITFTVDGTEKLEAVITATNSYSKVNEASLVLKGTKTVDGSSEVPANKFKFRVTDITNYNASDAPSMHAAVPASDVTNAAGGSFSISGISFPVAGTYKLKVVEVTGSDAQYVYDPTEYTLSVKTKADTNKLIIEEVKSKAGDADEITLGAGTDGSYALKKRDSDNVSFDNTTKKGQLTIEKIETVNGTAKPNVPFTFYLTDSKGNQYTCDANGKAVLGTGGITVNSGAEKSVTITDLPLDTYTLTEADASRAGYTLSTTYQVVNGSATNQVTFAPSAAETVDEKTIICTNAYTVFGPASVVIPGTKTLEGKKLEDNQFSFRINSKDGQDTWNGLPKAVNNRADGSITFPALAYTANDLNYSTEPQVFKYEISESTEAGDGITVDPRVYTVTVTVSPDVSAGKYTAAITDVTVRDSAAATDEKAVSDKKVSFVNKYETTPVRVPMEAEKKLEGAALKVGQFKFKLTPEDSKDSNKTQTKYNDAAGKVAFDSLRYDTPGTYTYNVTENSTSGDGVTTDASVYVVTIKVTDNGKGRLEYTKEIKLNGNSVMAIIFKNKYEAGSTTAKIEAKKAMSPSGSRDIKDGEFSFTLTPVKAEDTNPDRKTPDDPETIAITDPNAAQTVSNDGSSISFEEMTYTQTGVYEYSLEENETNIHSIGKDPTVYKVLVNVTDNGRGQLSTAVTYWKLKSGSDTEYEQVEDANVLFVNTYHFGNLKLKKEVTGNKALTDANTEFTFNISLSADDKPVSGSYKYTLGGAEKSLTFIDGKATVKLKKDQEIEILKLPDGASYEVNEVEKTGYVTTWKNNKNSGTISESDSPTPELVCINEHNAYGNMTIQKLVKGNAKDGNARFNISVIAYTDKSKKAYIPNGKYGSVTFTDGNASIELGDGESVAIENLPYGAYYEVKEENAGEYEATAVTKNGKKVDDIETTVTPGTDNQSVTVTGCITDDYTGDKLLVVTITNTKNRFGGFKLKKNLTVSDGGELSDALKARKFRFTVTLTDTSINGQYGDLNFTNGAASVELAHDQEVSVYPLAHGTGYTIVEDDYSEDGFEAVTGTIKGSVTGTRSSAEAVTSNDLNNVNLETARNNYTLRGTLNISKLVNGNMAQKVISDNTVFTIQVKLWGDAWKKTDGGATKTTYSGVEFNHADGIGTFTLHGSESKSISGIPHGTRYQVSEVYSDSASKDGFVTTILINGVVEKDNTSTINGRGDNNVTITNTKDMFGGLRLRKVTAGSDPDKKTWFAMQVELSDKTISGQYGDVNFQNGISTKPIGTTDVDYTNGKVPDGYFKITKDKDLYVLGLPAGITYTVREDSYSGTYDSQTGVNTSGTIMALAGSASDVTPALIDSDNKAASNQVTWTNIRNRTGKLVVKKLLEGNPINPDQSFNITITMHQKDGSVLTGTYDGVSFDSNGVANVSLKAGEERTITGLPLNATFTVVETVPGDGYMAPSYELSYRESVRDENGDAVKDGENKDVKITRTFQGNGSTWSPDSTGTPDATIKVDQRVVTVTNKTTHVTITKADFNNTRVLLAGAKFQLFEGESASGDVIHTWVTSTAGETINGLKINTRYTLHEVYPPKGYKAVPDVTFTINDQNKVILAAADNHVQLTSDDALLLKDEKASIPDMKKKIKDANDSEGTTSDWQDSADYDIGDDVPYRLTATLADNVTDYVKYHITFHDEMEDGLDFNPGSVKVTVAGTETTDYEITSDTKKFDLTLTWQGINGAKITEELNSKQVVVEFTAKLNDNAKLGSEGNVNKAKLEYSCNPKVNDDGTPVEETEETPWDAVIAFTYKTEISKVDKDGHPLTGAGFTLEKVKSGTKVKVQDYVVSENENTFTFTGLDDGEYILTETKIPVGCKGVKPIRFKVEAVHSAEWNSETGEGRTSVLTSLTGTLQDGKIAIVDEKLDDDTATGNLTGRVKNEEASVPEFKKKVKDVNDSTGAASGWQDSADYDIGDDVPFQLSATLADNVTDYNYYWIEFHDVMEPSLTFKRIESVKVGDDTLTASNYEFKKTSDQEFTLKVFWEGSGESKITNGSLNEAEVEVIFYAELNENANIGSKGNINKSEFSYSINPNLKKGDAISENDKGTKPNDYVIVFTYKADISKVDKDGKTPLKGAEFKLEKVMNSADPVEVRRLTVTDETTFSFSGLDDGIYILTETKIPKGHKLIKPIQFVIDAEHASEWDANDSNAEDSRTQVLETLTGKKDDGSAFLTRDESSEAALSGNVKNDEAEQPDFKKKVMDVNDSTGASSGWQDSADYDIDDDVPFQLSATLADNVTDYYKYNIQFHDVMEKSLTFQRVDSVKVNGKDLPAANYKLTKTSDQEFTLDLNWEGAGDARIADASLNKANVEVVFYAKLNENAVLGKQGNVNQAEFSYSNNPNLKKGEEEKPGDRGSKPWDSVIVFTYQTVINKVDASGAALAGAEFKLEKALKSGGTETISRVTVADGTKFTFTGLDDGVYTLTETKTPLGFSTIAPITFTVSATHNEVWEGTDRTTVLTALTGDVTSGALSLSADTELKTLTGNVKNDKQTGSGSIEVTKYTLKKDRSFKVSNETYYTALFSDAALTNRVSDVKALVLRNAYTTSVTFTNLAFGTYYVGETNASGTPVSTAANISKVEIENGTVTLSGASPTGSSVIKNTVPEGVLGAYADVRLKISKKVQNTSGDALNVNDTFYFALYSDAACTKRVKGVDIVSVKLNGTSSGSASFRELPYSSAFYVAEVNKNGKKVESSNSFGYKVKVAGDGLTYKAVNGATVTVTNKRKKGKPAGANRENGTQGAQGQQAAVRTGDTTPVMPMLITMITAGLAALYLAIRRKRRA